MSGVFPPIALAQINPTVGDLSGNLTKIIDAYHKASGQGAQLVVCPELALIGYPPEDLVLMPAFRNAVMETLHRLAEQVHGAALLVGSIWEEAGSVYNAAILIDEGKIVHVQRKTMLPNEGIFDEKRLFVAGDGARVISWRGRKLGILVCEDMWHNDLTAQLKAQGAEQIIVINASPFEAEKLRTRKKVAAVAACAVGVPLLYVNMVGGQDDIVFDGASFAVSPDGRITMQAPVFVEQVALVADNNAVVNEDSPAGIWGAMKLGLADYVHKNNFSGVVLGLSGGIDSALTVALAVDALGADKVHGVLLPSPYTSADSIEDALESAKLLGIKTTTVSIAKGMNTMSEVLNPVFGDVAWMENVAIGGNVQARLRGLTLMSISNRYGWLLLSTGNKSEIAVGYSTLYGDSCGGYNVVKDLYKTQIYMLADWRNAQERVIPQRSITKAPTAELAPGQKDSDQLPPYDVLDRILALHIEGRQSAAEIVAQGFDSSIVEKVVRMVRVNEYKRRQSCPGVKLSPMLFGKDRRYPLTTKF